MCPALARGAVWGLVRSAQSEHPGRFVLIDLEGDWMSTGTWASRERRLRGLLAAALASGEPQIAVRGGAVLVPRLARVASSPGGDGTRPALDGTVLDPRGTVLITGGTGGLGALVARHLVRAHGVRHLLLVSRSGPQAPGAAELQAELSELGAQVRIAAVRRGATAASLQRLLDSIGAEHPLCGVVHAAGVLDDGVIESLSGERWMACSRRSSTAPGICTS